MADDQNKLPADKAQKRIPRRSLFGNERSEDTDEWLRELEKRNLEEKEQKWNFDFREGKPLNQDKPILPQGEEPNLPSPSHVYEAVDAKEVPAFYRSKTELATITECLEPCTSPAKIATSNVKSRKRKLDEKAEEEQNDLAVILRREKANWMSPSGKEARQKAKEEGRGKEAEQGGTPKKLAKKEEGARVD